MTNEREREIRALVAEWFGASNMRWAATAIGEVLESYTAARREENETLRFLLRGGRG